ncbi:MULTISPECIES: hypothetical protein [Hymenobacter]|uniref:Uncharacterized protein n=2 Tax=Hymenobacter TaxID=89966 RepID=A0ABS6X3H9_9BACT|nr:MULTISPECIES: hypothetical protein [Hymenobacter]MBO3270953.1 hypothetical protein [Hymenobacter defluvii]MBW3130392.1 hypothetical protein [Hymenobacter profundi]QNE39663.1 hypothetical protein F1C16_08910 [Hymenobacter sp. NBH84]
MQQDSRHIMLIWLLLGALLLSTGLNCYLVLPQNDTAWVGWLGSDDEDEDEELPSVPNAIEELRLTRAMLARCQAEHLRKDSLLVSEAASKLPATAAASGLR